MFVEQPLASPGYAKYVDMPGDSKDIPAYASWSGKCMAGNMMDSQTGCWDFSSPIALLSSLLLTLILPNRAIITYPAKNKNSKYNNQVKK